MKDHIVYDMVCEIYATFQKLPPKRESRIVEKLVESLEDVPDRVASYIETRVGQNNNLPTNLIKACREAWESYCLAHPTAKAERNRCPYCYGNGGWVYFKVSEGKTWQFWSFCPHCQPENESTRKTPRQLQDEGALVMPSNYPGGVVKFRQDYGIDAPAPVNEYARRSIENLRAMMKRVQPGYAEG